MKRIAMKTINYLPDYPFTYSSNNQRVTGTKADTYDEFLMTCTVFDFDGELSCWISLDQSGITKMIYNIFKEEIDKVTDKIPEDHFYLSSTHTHSGPDFIKADVHSKPMWVPELREDMADICFSAAQKASGMVKECLENLQPFTAEIKVTDIVGCYSNRNALDAPCDKAHTLIRFKNPETGEPVGMWMNMSCHATMIFPRTVKMSTDLIGGVNKRLAAYYNTQIMSTCGCQGDTSTRLTRNRTDSEAHDLAELERIVSGVVEQVLADPENFEPIDIDRFQVTKYQVGFHYNQDPQVTEKRIERLQKDIDAATNPDQIRIKKDAMRALTAQRGITEFQNTLQGVAINMGELKIGVFPGELVASLGLQVVRHKSHDHRVVICYTNDRVGYLVEREEYGKNFESLSSIIPIGVPEVLTAMMVKEMDQFNL